MKAVKDFLFGDDHLSGGIDEVSEDGTGFGMLVAVDIYAVAPLMVRR